MKALIITLVSTVLTASVIPVSGQNQHHFPIQVSFVYPIGTHGYKSNSTTFDFSLNMLTGYTGGVDGFEVGGLINMNKGNVSGFQVAGLANITGGNVSGFQAAGIFGKADSVDGMQINGIYGQVETSSDLQVSGIANVSKQSRVTIAGIANINRDAVNGIQISGIINTTRKLNGIQVGLINIADSSNKSLSIGLVNIIHDRFFDEYSFDIADYENFGIGYRLGTRELYTVFSAGFNVMEEKLWVFGLGLGHEERISPVFSVRPEMVWYTYFPMAFDRPIRDTWTYHIRVAMVRDLNKMFAFSVAPGIYFAEKSNRGTETEYGYEHTPIPSLFDVRPAGSSNKLYFGFGLSLSVILK